MTHTIAQLPSLVTAVQTNAKFRSLEKDVLQRWETKAGRVVLGLAGSLSWQEDGHPAAHPLVWPRDKASFPCDVLTALRRYRFVWPRSYESMGNAKGNNAGKLFLAIPRLHSWQRGILA